MKGEKGKEREETRKHDVIGEVKKRWEINNNGKI